MTTFATTEGTKPKAARLNTTGFDVVRVILVLILLAAAALAKKEVILMDR